MLIKPKSIEIADQDGVEKTFILSKFPAVAGREIVTQYPVSNIPKLGEYGVSETIMLKLLAFVAVETPAGPLALTTRALVDNHVPDWETLLKLEWHQLEYNVSFFGNGRSFDFFANIKATAPKWISQMLTLLSAQLSQANSPPIGTSAPS